MTDVKPGQIWERQSTPGAPWRRVCVENVLTDDVELRFLDIPTAPELEQVFATSRTHMLGGGGHGQGAAYRMPTAIDDVKPLDRYLVKWSVGLENYPTKPFSTEPDALGYIRELFLEHGARLHVELYLNDATYLGFRRLSQWNAGKLSLP